MNITTRFLHIITLVDRDSERRLRDAIDGTPGRHTLVVGPASARQPLQRMASKVEVIQLPNLVAHATMRQQAVVITQLTRLARRRGYAVIHSHSPRASIIARAVAKAAHIPLVCESQRLDEPDEGVAKGRLMAKTQGMVDMFFVETEAEARRLTATGVSSDRVALVRTSVPLDDCRRISAAQRRKVRELLGVDPDCDTVSFVGRLDRHSGADVVHDVAAKVASGRTLQLLVVGDGPLETNLDDQVAGLTIHRLESDADPAAVVTASNVVLSPARGQRLSGVLVQAAASDVPIVAYAGEGVDEILSLGARGRTVPQGNVDALAAALAAEFGEAGEPETLLPKDEGNRVWNSWTRAVVAINYRWHYEPNPMQPI